MLDPVWLADELGEFPDLIVHLVDLISGVADISWLLKLLKVIMHRLYSNLKMFLFFLRPSMEILFVQSIVTGTVGSHI